MPQDTKPEVARHFKTQHFVKKLEALQDAIACDIKNTFLQAKAHGLQEKALKALLKLRAEDDDKAFQRKLTESFTEKYQADMQLELFDLWDPETDELTPVSVTLRLAERRVS